MLPSGFRSHGSSDTATSIIWTAPIIFIWTNPTAHGSRLIRNLLMDIYVIFREAEQPTQNGKSNQGFQECQFCLRGSTTTRGNGGSEWVLDTRFCIENATGNRSDACPRLEDRFENGFPFWCPRGTVVVKSMDGLWTFIRSWLPLALLHPNKI